MLHAHTKIWVHLIWSTKGREKMLNKQVRIALFDHIIARGQAIGVGLERVNVQLEHVHCLFDLPSDRTLAEVAQKLKGESSRWINRKNLVRGHFNWQRGYGGFSVSASLVDTVKNYIANQDDHHRRMTFAEEYKRWCDEYGIEVE